MNEKTLLLRQVHPSWIQQDRVTSQTFKPTPKDENKLSVYDGDMITPEDSWEEHRKNKRGESVGVLAVSVSECHIHSLPVEPDPDEFPEHVLINFDGYGRKDRERKAKHLMHLAKSRGWLFQSEEY